MIFDMDGVIIDSMLYHYKAWEESLAPLGIKSVKGVYVFKVIAVKTTLSGKHLKKLI